MGIFVLLASDESATVMLQMVNPSVNNAAAAGACQKRPAFGSV